MPRYYLPKINKYVTFAASLPVALSGGLAYLFPIWAPALKDAYALSQSQLEALAACHNIGGYSSFISGFFYDLLEHRHHVGPRLSLALGATASFIGFSGLWLAITRRFVATTLQLAFLAFLAGSGGTWYDTCTLATNLRNFPAHRGTVVGTIKAGVGLSSALYSSAYSSIFEPHADRFLLFLAIVPPVVGLLGLPLMNYVPWVQQSELEGGWKVFSPEGRFFLAVEMLGALALYLTITALARALGELSIVVQGIMSVGALLLLLPVLVVPAGSGGLFAQRAGALRRGRLPPSDLNLELENEEGEGEGGSAYAALLEASPERLASPEPPLDEVVPMPQYTLSQCFKLLNFWLMAVTCGIGMGSCLALLNNSAQFTAAISAPPEARIVVVSLFGATSCLGRLLFGIVPEKALHLYGIPRPAFLAAAGTLVGGSLTGLAFASVPVMYALVALAGLAFGAHWSLLPSLTSELFGLDSFATIYTLLQLFPAGMAYAFGAGLFGALYEKHSQGGVCIGPDCYRLAFLIMAGMAGAAACASTWLTVRTRRMYSTEAKVLQIFESDPAENDPFLR